MGDYAIVMNLDKKSTARLMNMMCGSFMLENGIRPQLTLAVFDCGNDIDALDSFDRLTRRLEVCKVRFGSISACRSRGSCETIDIFAVGQLTSALRRNNRRAYTILSQNFVMTGGEELVPGLWEPWAMLGMRLSDDDADGYFDMVRRMFRPFDAVASETALVRLRDNAELSVYSLATLADGIPTKSFTELRPGMTAEQVSFVLGKKLVLQKHTESGHSYNFVKFGDIGVTLFFNMETGRLYTIRLDKPFPFPALGCDRNAVESEMGLPDRYVDSEGYSSKRWLYDKVIPGHTLRLDFNDENEGECAAVFIV